MSHHDPQPCSFLIASNLNFKKDNVNLWTITLQNSLLDLFFPKLHNKHIMLIQSNFDWIGLHQDLASTTYPPWIFFQEKFLTSSFILIGSSTKALSICKPFKNFLLLLQLITEWKILKLQSPSFNQFNLAFWHNKDSLNFTTRQKSFWSLSFFLKMHLIQTSLLL